MANKAKEKTSEEMLVEEIQSLGRTHGVNTVFISGTYGTRSGNPVGPVKPDREAGKLWETGEIH